MGQYFEFVKNDTITVEGHILHRIRCTRDCKWAKKGEFGGYNVVSAALLGKIAPYVKFEVRASECRRVRKFDNHKGEGIYGGGYLLSDKATARKIEAYEQAAKQATVIVLELSEREKRIITELE